MPDPVAGPGASGQARVDSTENREEPGGVRREASCTAVVLYRSCPAEALAKADLRSNARTIRSHGLRGGPPSPISSSISTRQGVPALHDQHFTAVSIFPISALAFNG